MYGADAVLKVNPADAAGTSHADDWISRRKPSTPAEAPPVADIGVIDDGSFITGELMNLLARRNLLFHAVVTAPSSQFLSQHRHR